MLYLHTSFIIPQGQYFNIFFPKKQSGLCVHVYISFYAYVFVCSLVSEWVGEWEGLIWLFLYTFFWLETISL